MLFVFQNNINTVIVNLNLRSLSEALPFCLYIFCSYTYTNNIIGRFDPTIHLGPPTNKQAEYRYNKMVIGLLAITAIPTVTGIALGCSEQRKQNARQDDEKRMAKFYTDVVCTEDVEEADELDEKRVVLRNNKVYIDDPNPAKRKVESHTGQAFYIDYPEPDHMKDLKRGLGLVSTIQDNPPMLNWIYCDKETHELKYGNRTQSCEHVPAPWDWTDNEMTIILERNWGFYAVKEKDAEGRWSWAVYLDRDGDDLQRVLGDDVVAVPVKLKRTLVGTVPADSNQTGGS
ncbi:uncharacterized protein ANIA_10135 [Aspergillus nidulans FGSC A4]|uniref:Uncharacterized protein n=1 Tax=Emericella nidulans (strain FGSC A4 / ATCC 38163 / CBS 112.46 / NRRL 194 / M139) TaxID=227321 RepID=C8VUH7_EMENI|nr:hypothetical protein [Aspergillus nidulans FGSC A4]CBF88475.1 TPA: conserved hypothetical protein [Aspergillus nidulans FGSC A4]